MSSHSGCAYLEIEIDEQSPNAHIPVYRGSETAADDFASLLTVIEEPMCVCAYSLFLTLIIRLHLRVGVHQ